MGLVGPDLLSCQGIVDRQTRAVIRFYVYLPHVLRPDLPVHNVRDQPISSPNDVLHLLFDWHCAPGHLHSIDRPIPQHYICIFG